MNNKVINLNDDTYKTYILNTVNDLCPSKKKTIYSNQYYLTHITYLVNDVCKWKSLSIVLNNKSKFHWKTIENKFRQWCKLNIFQIAYERMLSDNILSEYKSSTTLDLYLDSCDTGNVNGSEKIGYSYKNKNKKNTKISFICDRYKNVYGLTFYAANTPDVNTIISSINNIKDKFKYRKINLICDKGYISESIKKELKKKKINLICPHKKNMKKKHQKIQKRN